MPLFYSIRKEIGCPINVLYDIQVSGTFLAIYFCSHDSDEDASNELGIWNWITGELQAVSHYCNDKQIVDLFLRVTFRMSMEMTSDLSLFYQTLM